MVAKELDLSWGDPKVVRQALEETLGPKFGLAPPLLSAMGYTPHLGFPHLVDQCKDLAERISGHRPKHLVITCGATGAIHAALYALKDRFTDFVVTNRRYFPIYPSIITMSDMVHIDWSKQDSMIHKGGYTKANFLSLVDSPSNPEGHVDPFGGVDIWDAAYASNTYSSGGHTPQDYKVMCGSLSKITGLAGLRLGWASTDFDLLAESMNRYVVANYVGLSGVSMYIAESVLHSLDFTKFEKRSSDYLNDNREQAQRLLDSFGQGNVPSRGMFTILRLGKPEKKALQRANIKWQPGNTWGEDESWARLSLGQTREVVKAAVRAVLK